MRFARPLRGRPLEHQVVFSPGDVTRSYGPFQPATHHGTVVGGDWDLQHHHFSTNPLARAALQHWRDGVDWVDTGAVELQLRRIREYGPALADGMSTRDDVMRRYDRLDQLFELVRRTGELPPHTRPRDLIYLHLDRHGEPVFGHRGVHRFVITHVLQVPSVTAQLGAVHAAAPQALWLRVAVRTGFNFQGRLASAGPVRRRSVFSPRADRGTTGRRAPAA